MKIYEIKIKPHSSFISLIQGDMLFGSLCWQILQIGKNLDVLLQDYSSNPFMVVSSGFYYFNGEYILPKPLCPDFLMFPNVSVKDRKLNKAKAFFKYKGDIIKISDLSFETLSTIKIPTKRMHNSINRKTGNTGSSDLGEFSPFSINSNFYRDKGHIVIFVGIDESRFSREDLLKSFINLGRVGFGKRASAGYGHFSVESCEESLLWKKDFSIYNYLYALSPFVLSMEEQKNLNNIYFQPFTRYGKHGNIQATSTNPFKKPIIMADEASLVSLKQPLAMDKPYIGKAITNISYVDSKTIAQGYALCLPCLLEEK